MTTQETERVDVVPARTASTVSASRAYQRRMRRQQALEGARLTRTGSPIASALTRVPFVAMVILLLAGGIVGVLWLNTMSDAAGLRASQSRLNQLALNTSIQAASREIATLKDPAVLATQAQSLGLVPPGNAAMLEVGKDGKGTVIGTPTPVPAAAAPLAATRSGPATTAPATTTPATTAPATTTPATTAPASKARTAPATTAVAKLPPAKKATTAGSAAAKTTQTQVKPTSVKTTAKATTAKAAATTTSAAKATTAKATTAKATTATNRSRQAPVTTGAGQ